MIIYETKAVHEAIMEIVHKHQGDGYRKYNFQYDGHNVFHIAFRKPLTTGSGFFILEKDGAVKEVDLKEHLGVIELIEKNRPCTFAYSTL